jgi:hypothetical protein
VLVAAATPRGAKGATLAVSMLQSSKDHASSEAFEIKYIFNESEM